MKRGLKHGRFGAGEVAAVLALTGSALKAADAFPRFRVHEVNPAAGTGLAIAAADVNGDGRLDIIGVSAADVYWYANPSWRPRLIAPTIRGSNVCVAPMDLDGDGLPELVLGADWQFTNTESGGSLHLLWRGPDAEGPWNVRELLVEPTLHRIRWSDTDGDGRAELIVAPLKGRGTTPPNFAERGVRLMRLRPPRAPWADPWPIEVIDASLHVLHNVSPHDFDGDGRDELLVASFEGVTAFKLEADGGWSKRALVAGNPEPLPNSGAGEIRVGWVKPGVRALATIEPWHGHQAVVYVPEVPPGGLEATWRREVIDDQLAGGHAVAWADFDGDGEDELLVGYREKAGPRELPGLNIYNFDWIETPQGPRPRAIKHTLDEGGMATEEAVAADFNGDGRPDVAAFGRATRNIRFYENLGPRSE